MDINQAKQQQQKRQQWAECDPVTLVSAAKQTLYSEVQGSGGGSDAQLAPLEEIISRFEHQTRASLGTAPFAVGSSSRSS